MSRFFHFFLQILAPQLEEVVWVGVDLQRGLSIIAVFLRIFLFNLTNIFFCETKPVKSAKAVADQLRDRLREVPLAA